MMCNYMSEGCSGGLSFINGLFTETAHLASEKCAPYKANTKGDKCGNYKDCPAQAKIEKTYYLNGYNFSPTEK